MQKLQQTQNFNVKNLKRIPLIEHTFDNGFTEKWEFNTRKNAQGLLVDFIQTVTSDLNKWQRPNTVTDKCLHRYLFSQTMLDLGLSEQKLKNYIKNNFQQDNFYEATGFNLQTIDSLAQKSQTIQVSLPYGLKIPREPRKYQTTFLPVTVKMDNYDLSSSFVDYDHFGPEIVNQVFDSLVNGNVPEIRNDLFNRQEITDLANKLLS